MADKEQLMHLAQTAYGQYSNVLGPEHWQMMSSGLANEERFTELLQKSQSYVCADGEKIVGMAYLMPSGNPTPLFEAEWSYIRLVGVDPEYSGRGIAKALTKMCLDHARQAGEKTVALHTSEFMDAARHIYESMGFTAVRQIDEYLGKKYWIYTLPLT